MADKPATLTLKLGDHEVRYEGEREAVEAQLELLVGRLLDNATTDFQVGIAGGSAQVPAPSPPATASAAPATPEAVPEARRLKQLYAQGKDGRLRLRKLPGRTADTLLLVLYGLLKLQGRKSVHAPGMTSAARASGARFERADRLLAGYDDLVEGFGQRRGKQYRLTAAGREHCRRLVESLVGPIAPGGGEDPEGEDERAPAREARIPEKVTRRWHGELLTVAEAAERLGIGEAEVGVLRRRWELLGLPGGDRQRRHYFYPAFQIDAERRQIIPQVGEANLLASRRNTSWGIAEWWSSIEPHLDQRPIDLVATPRIDEIVRAARAQFIRSG